MNRPAALTSVQSLHLVKGEIHTSKYVGSDTANEEEQRYLQQERVKRGGGEKNEKRRRRQPICGGNSSRLSSLPQNGDHLLQYLLQLRFCLIPCVGT